MLLIISAGCGGKDNIKQSADSITAQSALNAADIIREAYQNKDKSILLAKLDPALSEAVISNLSFEKAELTFNPRMIKIMASGVAVQMIWHGEWTVNGKILKDRGAGMFVFNKDATKLMQIEGDNMFYLPASVQ